MHIGSRLVQAAASRMTACVAAMLLALTCAAQTTSPLASFESVSGPSAPTPLVQRGKAVDWWFVFKLNAKVFPSCEGGQDNRACPFGGTPQAYEFGQRFVYASSADPNLKLGGGCLGDTTDDPVGATFDEIYNGSLYYVVWNDQFYDDPSITGCGQSCSSPWGHSKGIIAWNDAGDGVVMQVTTPSWPASGNANNPRQGDGNTLGCVKDDDVKVSQHFFALKLTRDDVVAVLQALQNASVVTDPNNPQIVRNGGPGGIQAVVNTMGVKSSSTSVMRRRLTSGIGLISKPSAVHVPPWQLVSASLGGIALRTATWWTTPKIPTTQAGDAVGCWDSSLGTPGPVQVATSGQWEGKVFGLQGGPGADFNHAKFGVALNGGFPLVIFGDMNQQGSLSGPNCASSQNGRGGVFFVLENEPLATGITNLISGSTAPGTGD